MTAGYDHPKDPGKVRIVDSIFAENAGPIWVSAGLELEVVDSLLTGSRNKLEIVHAREPEAAVGAAGVSLDKLGKSARGVRLGGDAAFVDAEAGDYHLGGKSAGRDQGNVEQPYPRTDLDGKPRVRGGKPDLGCFEAG
jgi:hypothetical protein